MGLKVYLTMPIPVNDSFLLEFCKSVFSSTGNERLSKQETKVDFEFYFGFKDSFPLALIVIEQWWLWLQLEKLKCYQQYTFEYWVFRIRAHKYYYRRIGFSSR